MRSIAAYIIIGVFLLVVTINLLFIFKRDTQWTFRQSPKSGICYEIYREANFLGVEVSMNEVDCKYCEK